MHEASLMQAALELAAERVRESGGSRIHWLRLRVGMLSGVVPEALRFAFEALSDGTLAAGAGLEIVTVPAVSWCEGCGAEFEANDYVQECPRCHEVSVELRRGREMELESMEIS